MTNDPAVYTVSECRGDLCAVCTRPLAGPRRGLEVMARAAGCRARVPCALPGFADSSYESGRFRPKHSCPRCGIGYCGTTCRDADLAAGHDRLCGRKARKSRARARRTNQIFWLAAKAYAAVIESDAGHGGPWPSRVPACDSHPSRLVLDLQLLKDLSWSPWSAVVDPPPDLDPEELSQFRSSMKQEVKEALGLLQTELSSEGPAELWEPDFYDRVLGAIVSNVVRPRCCQRMIQLAHDRPAGCGHFLNELI